MRRRGVFLATAFAVALVALTGRSFAGPMLHEPIPPDPFEDQRLYIGDPLRGSVVETPGGVVRAPDVDRPVDAKEHPYGSATRASVDPNHFAPDRDTSRPETLPYDDPFSPSTAPFKRLAAYDAVDANYSLSIQRPSSVTVETSAEAPPGDALFFADIPVDTLSAKRPRVRVPGVVADAKVLQAQLSSTGQLVGFRLAKDSADNWTLETDAQVRARLVLKIAAPPGSFGGEYGDPKWADLPAAPPLPPRAQSAANIVAGHLGVSRAQKPKAVVAKLVAYFRSFVDSDAHPEGNGDIYLDLALSKKGVCRHRAFAFMVTALGLGIPTRVVLNEAHAWVEVHDATLWRRIDLGGAGRNLRDPLGGGVALPTSPDAFPWPAGATPGQELAARARTAAPVENGGAAPSPSGSMSAPSPLASNLPPPPSVPKAAPSASPTNPNDLRTRSILSLTLEGAPPRRGAALRVTGMVTADGEPCPHLAVEVVLQGSGNVEATLGALATDAKGRYSGALVVPKSVTLGDYDVVARTRGDARCGTGAGP